MKRIIIGVAALSVIAVIGVVVLYSSLGALITKAITTAGPEILLARVELKETVIDATSGKGSMHGLFIGNPEGFETESAFKMNEVRLELDTDSLTSDTVVIKEIFVEAPEVTYELGGDGSNIDAIQKNVEAFIKQNVGSTGGKGDSAAKEGGAKMVIENVIVKNGKVNVSATLLGGKTMTVPLPDIHLKDIGKEDDGATPGEAIQSILGALKGAILEAVSPLNLGKVGETVGNVVDKGTGMVKDTTKGVTDAVSGIFGK